MIPNGRMWEAAGGTAKHSSTRGCEEADVQVIVCESHSHWTVRISHWLAAKRKSIAQLRYRLVTVRDEQAVFQLLGNAECSAVCWEVCHDTAQQMVQAIRRQRREFPRSLPVVVGPAITTSWEPLLVLAGAAWVGDGPMAVPLLGRLVLRHASMQSRPAPDQWWQEDLPALPWQEVATG
jgi:hypothetical protein